jgi:hypothetical protein
MSNHEKLKLDMEIYIMGDTKLEFISFLSDCFKENFFETLSWGNFRRFQLLLENNNIWLNIFFVLLNNEQNGDLIINNFKIFEKRNFLLMVYIVNDSKSEKQIDNMYESFLAERDKLYDGILNDDIITKNLKKITNKKINHEEFKNNLDFLIGGESNLIYKLGFVPNIVNKRTKNYKKSNDNHSLSYNLNQEIFYFTMEKEEVKSDFETLINYLIKEHFKKIRANIPNEYLNFSLDFISNDKKKNEKKEQNFLIKMSTIINYLIILYISFELFKYFAKN